MNQTITREQQWENMRVWLKSTGIEPVIRSVAVARLSQDWPEGEGMGSSDISCALMSLYESWLRTTEREPNASPIEFLSEYNL